MISCYPDLTQEDILTETDTRSLLIGAASRMMSYTKGLETWWTLQNKARILLTKVMHSWLAK